MIKNILISLLITVNIIALVVGGFYLLNSSPSFEEEIITTQITVHYLDKIEDIPANAGKALEDMSIGYSIWSAETAEPRTCEIFVVKPDSPTDQRRMETLGHELFHCTHHRFHE